VTTSWRKIEQWQIRQNVLIYARFACHASDTGVYLRRVHLLKPTWNSTYIFHHITNHNTHQGLKHLEFLKLEASMNSFLLLCWHILLLYKRIRLYYFCCIFIHSFTHSFTHSLIYFYLFIYLFIYLHVSLFSVGTRGPRRKASPLLTNNRDIWHLGFNVFYPDSPLC